MRATITYYHNSSCLISFWSLELLNKNSLSIYYSALSLVAGNTTYGAFPTLYASNHLKAHKHQLSPGFKPGNEWPRGVDRSFPFNILFQWVYPAFSIL